MVALLMCSGLCLSGCIGTLVGGGQALMKQWGGPSVTMLAYLPTGFKGGIPAGVGNRKE